MRFVSVRELRSQSATLWKELPDERQMIVTSNGKPVAILAAVDERDLEQSIAAIRQAGVLEALQAIQLESVSNGTDGMTMEQIDAEIAAARLERRARIARDDR
jgi:antitoxin (DNA-binding transcriptional repressor) of toxin-antitoxin stability system